MTLDVNVLVAASRPDHAHYSIGLTGNAIPDAWIAVAAKSSGLHLVTLDRDFARLLDPSHYTLLRP